MTDSRSEFYEWRLNGNDRPENTTEWALEIWQAGRASGQADAARRCAEIAADMVEDSEFPGYNTACGEIGDAIKAEFPEAFK